MNRRTFVSYALFLFCFMVFFPGKSAAVDPRYLVSGLPRTLLEIKELEIEVEVATGEAVNIGMMFRTYLAKNEGMLFVFEPPRRTGMWMENTLIPLSVAFLSEDGIILNIEKMEPLTRDLHLSSGVAAFALEMNQGWFERNDVKPGDAVRGLPKSESSNSYK